MNLPELIAVRFAAAYMSDHLDVWADGIDRPEGRLAGPFWVAEVTPVQLNEILDRAEMYADWKGTEDYADNRWIVDSAIRVVEAARKLGYTSGSLKLALKTQAVAEVAPIADEATPEAIVEEAPVEAAEEDGVVALTVAGQDVKFTAREQWLQVAVGIFRSWFADAGFELPANIRLSCGLAGSKITSKTLGECWAGEASADGCREVFISPVLDDPSRVLDVLVHELCHCLYPVSEGHGKNFGHAARTMGLVGKLTATTASPELVERLAPVIETLGAYPHAAMSGGMSGKKKQTTRLIKLVCPGCEYTCRTTAKWLEIGVPTCCCGEEMEPVIQADPSDEEEGGGE